MTDWKSYIKKLLELKGHPVSAKKQHLFDDYIQDPSIETSVNIIQEQQSALMNKWTIKNRIDDISNLHIVIPNATDGKPYSAFIDYNKFGFNDLMLDEWFGLEELGLHFNKDTHTIEGTPNKSGELKFKFFFKVEGEEENTPTHEKTVTLVVNPDPKTLWKDIPSDTNALFWKADDTKAFGTLGEKHIVVASNRGRSHENVGSFRDDDFSFKFLDNIGWSVVAVSDGAGSATLSRKGSELACQAIVEYFEHQLDVDKFNEFEQKLRAYEICKDENLLKSIEGEAKQKMYKAVLFAYERLKITANETQAQHPELFHNPKAKHNTDYFHSTLITALFKKFEFGYVVITFGVGDCPIAIMNEDRTNTTLLNVLDVGEFGGGTRFVTQNDIYLSDAKPLSMVQRFNMHITPDFSYLFLMTDGIYDAKFVVEANLEKHEKWMQFLEDLEGKNDDKSAVNIDANNPNIADELATWMDFWSPGNHDDRTLAIIF